VGEQAPVNTGRAITIAVIVAATLWLAVTYAPEAPSYY